MNQKKAQIWSLDMLIGVAIFLIMISVFLAVIMFSSSGDMTNLRDQSDQIFIRLDSSRNPNANIPQIFSDSGVSKEQIQQLYFNSNYEQIKSSLGVRDDFCIILLDDSGGIKGIEDPENPGVFKSSFGPSHIFVAPGIRCGDILE
ncbi:MAG: hypothetical protein ACMXX7_01635 [Candidatus Woesearchaeota archaeon]